MFGRSRKGDDYTFSFDRMQLPYLPYFSHCREFDSHVPLYALFEGEECALPEVDDKCVADTATPLSPVSQSMSARFLPCPDSLRLRCAMWYVAGTRHPGGAAPTRRCRTWMT